ncbi:hypothetical protein PLESTM_000540300 [Pleodorina starrii]|nr:hypothetical protein PLESTM_000540300 [Pleodorina starrii]
MSTRGRVGPFMQLTGEALDEYILIGTLVPLLNFPPDTCDTSTLAQPEDMKYCTTSKMSGHEGGCWSAVGRPANDRSLYISLPPNSWRDLRAPRQEPHAERVPERQGRRKDAVRSLAFATKSVSKPADERDLRDLSPVAAPEVQLESDSLATLLDRTGIDWSIRSNEGDDVMRALLGDLDAIEGCSARAAIPVTGERLGSPQRLHSKVQAAHHDTPLAAAAAPPRGQQQREHSSPKKKRIPVDTTCAEHKTALSPSQSPARGPQPVLTRSNTWIANPMAD